MFLIKEVGPTATTEPDVNLLAPEEIVRRTKAVPKSKIERTETDKKRERRHKKKRQQFVFTILKLTKNLVFRFQF